MRATDHTFPLFRNVTCSAGGRTGWIGSSEATPGDSTQEEDTEEESEPVLQMSRYSGVCKVPGDRSWK